MLTLLLLGFSSFSGAQEIWNPDRCVTMSDVRMVNGPIVLGGLTGMRVVVSDRFSWGSDSTLADSLRVDIEHALRRGDLRILSEDECSKTPGHPSLSFRAGGAKVALELRETACLSRRPDSCTPIVNYGIETSYSVSEPRLGPESVTTEDERAHAERVRAAFEQRRKECRDQEVQILHVLAVDLTGHFVDNVKYANRRETTK